MGLYLLRRHNDEDSREEQDQEARAESDLPNFFTSPVNP